MTSVGIMASAVVPSTSSLVAGAILNEPFNNTTAWTNESVTATIVAGRTGNAVQISNNGDLLYPVPAGSRSTTMVVGFACKISNISTVPNFLNYRCLGPPGSIDISLRVNADGSLTVLRSTTAPFGTSAVGLITANTWFYVEMSIFHANVGGTATVRVNNANAIGPLTNQDTNGGFNDTDTYTGVALNGLNAQTALFDDLYIKTGAGSTFAGDTPIIP